MKEKGIDEYIETAQRIKDKYDNVEFGIIGRCEEENYKEKIEDLQNKNIIQYYGQVDHVHDYIKESHCTIHPSYHEGMSNVLLETAATGRPVIASNIAGCKEIIENGKTGYVFAAKNVKALEEKVEEFIKMPYEEKIKMGLAGREKVEKEFDRKIVVDAYVKEINLILN